MLVNIVSPVSRPWNLAVMGASIDRSAGPGVELVWHVVFDSPSIRRAMKWRRLDPREDIRYYAYPKQDRGISGNPQRNHALDQLSGGYVYFLDDDNVVHPRLFTAALAHMREERAVIVNQATPDGTTRLVADAGNVRVGGIDTAQVLLPYSMIGDLRWDPFNYCADGVFCETVYRRSPDSFVFLQENLAYYNFLGPDPLWRRALRAKRGQV